MLLYANGEGRICLAPGNLERSIPSVDFDALVEPSDLTLNLARGMECSPVVMPRRSRFGQTRHPTWVRQKDNAAKYDKDEVETIKNEIKKTAKTHDVEISSG